MSKFKVGQEVIASNSYGRRGETPLVVRKVARKYVYASADCYSPDNERTWWSFDKETGYECGYAGGRLYTVQEWEEREVKAALYEKLKKLGVDRNLLGPSAFLRASAAQLQAIVDILEAS